MHRLHHAFSDTEDDPHSPATSKNLFDMMWKTKKRYSDIMYDKARDIDPVFYKNVPVWNVSDHFFDSWPVRILFAALYTSFYVFFAPNPWWFLLLPVHFFIGPVHGAIINWFAHKYGYVNFKLDNTSKNLLPVDFLMLGESYHNNHHKYPGRSNFGIKWHELDPVYPVILLLQKVKVVKSP